MQADSQLSITVVSNLSLSLSAVNGSQLGLCVYVPLSHGPLCCRVRGTEGNRTSSLSFTHDSSRLMPLLHRLPRMHSKQTRQSIIF